MFRAVFRLLLLGSLVAGWAALSGGVPAQATARPNVLLICVDDLKPALGCYGDRIAHTPNLDRLASRSLLFERAYCNQAVCSPSRNALMLGMRPTSLGIYDLPTHFRVAAPNAQTVAERFLKQGWRSEGLGKILHQGQGNHDDPHSWSVPHWRPGGGQYAIEANRPAGNREVAPRGPAVEAADVPDARYPDGKIADEAIRRLQAAKQQPETPFFLAVGFSKPHLPFCAPKKYWDLYRREQFPPHPRQTPPEGAPTYAPQFGGELRNYRDIPKQGALPAALQSELIHGYYAAASFTDAQIGKLLDELDRLRLAESTIVVLWGDHGWHLGDHGMWCKHTNYEQATRIPLMIAAPGVTQAGSRTRDLVETIDLYPTLCELAGVPLAGLPQKLDGRSLVPVLRDPGRVTNEAVFHAYPRNRPGQGQVIGRAVRTERHRLVEWKRPGADPATAELELYDYASDPEETRNLAADQPEVVSRLRALLARRPEARPQVRAAE
jgi:iduronate 2-sulfatase